MLNFIIKAINFFVIFLTILTYFTDGSLLYERVPNKPEVDRLTLTPPQVQPAMQTQQTILKRTRPPFDEINGSDGKFN